MIVSLSCHETVIEYLRHVPGKFPQESISGFKTILVVEGFKVLYIQEQEDLSLGINIRILKHLHGSLPEEVYVGNAGDLIDDGSFTQMLTGHIDLLILGGLQPLLLIVTYTRYDYSHPQHEVIYSRGK